MRIIAIPLAFRRVAGCAAFGRRHRLVVRQGGLQSRNHPKSMVLEVECASRGSAAGAATSALGKRGREYLTDREVERLIESAKQNRSGHRDATAILVAYRHGLAEEMALA